MKFYRFKTFTTSYYFPPLDQGNKFMYGLYSAYGGSLSKLYWWLFRHSSLFRVMHAVKAEDLGFTYAQIVALEKHGSIMSFNMGSPGPENKISILGYDNILQRRFFAKFSLKPKAIELSTNELLVLHELQDSGLVPRLYDFEVTPKYVFFKTAFIRGTRPHSIAVNEAVLNTLISLSAHYLPGIEAHELQHCLSHGDFCPWNLLVDDLNIRLIDWEMAANRPLGYDLFTYIFQPAFLLSQKKNEIILQENRKWIAEYFSHFDIQNWQPYLSDFICRKLSEETGKQNEILANHYLMLQAFIRSKDGKQK